MVVIHVKRPDGDGFLYETTCETLNDELIKELVWIWNTRLRLGQLVGGLRELGKYGPMKPLAEQGIDELKEKLEHIKLDKSEHYCADPSGIRTGNGPGPKLVDTLEKVCQDAELYISKAQVEQKVATKRAILQEKLDNIKGAVMMAYPMGLPEWDTVRLTLESQAGLEGTQASVDLLDCSTAQLWSAGKEFLRGQRVSDRLGKNEKTKVIAKLQKPGQGPPAREPAVTEDERKAMMAHYFKRQEEMKRLAESHEDEYLASSWADGKSLQKSLRGMDGIKAPGLRYCVIHPMPR